MTFAARLVGLVVLAYVAVVVLLYTQQSRLIYPAPQDIPPLTPGYSEKTLLTDDGLRLRAFYREADSGLPTAVYFHGNGGTLAGASVSNGALAKAGLGVLLVEYRGYGGNAGEPSEEGFYLDAQAALRWLSQHDIARDRTIVIGNSIGGGSATYAAQALLKEGKGPAGLILIAPFTSLPDVAADVFWWLPVRTFLRDTYPNQDRLRNLGETPVLIQHGTRDTVVGYGHGKALAQSSPTAEFQTFEEAGHGLSFEPRSQQARVEWILALNPNQAS